MNHSPRPFSRLLGLALLSGGGIFLQITLTRLFSTLFFPPYVFAIISVAILGLGLGAALAAWRPAWRRPARLPLYAGGSGLAALLLLLTVVWTVSVDWQGGLLAFVIPPYFFIGLALATLFSAAAEDSPQLYQADLVGAGLGAVLAIPLLDGVGALNGVLLAAALLGLAGVLLAPASGATHRRWPLALAGLAVIALGGNLAAPWLQVDLAALAAPKPITGSLAGGGRIIATEWDSFARTDLVDPGQGRPYQLYLDGAAGSVMPPAGDLSLLRTDIGFFPFATTQPAQVMIIGPGGGLDVWFALNSRARRVAAVEINPASVELVNRFAAYHGDLYGQPGVRVIIDEGRSVLRREQRRYDLIYLSQVVTLAAERSGYALTENSIYTVEAFTDYLAHLQPGGQIALKLYDELTLTRALVTAVTALKQSRALTDAEAMRHVAAFLDRKAQPPIPLLLVQDQPFSREDALSYAGVAAQVDFVPLFVPGVVAGPPLDGVLTGQTSLAEIMAQSSSDVSPTTDDRPFFYQFERGLPQSLQPLLIGLGGLSLLGLALLGWTQRPVRPAWPRYAPLYFAALGAGFIGAEIALIQQTRLFLGHPTLAVTTVLAVLLVGGGLGSGLAGRWPRLVTGRRLAGPALAVGLGLLLWLAIWPGLSRSFLAAETPGRLVVAGLALLPLALLLGMPFPLGLQAVGRFAPGQRHVALAWAVNGVLTVVGSAGAVAVAMLAGFSSVLLLAAVAYGLAALAAFLAPPLPAA